LALSAFGMIVDGIFTLESIVAHFVGFLLGAMTPVLSFLVIGLLLRRVPNWRRFGTWLLLGSPLTLALLVLDFATFDARTAGAGHGFAGLTQRILIVEVHAWFVALGWLASRPAAKGYKGVAMEGLIATWYARNTKVDVRHRACADAVLASLPA